MNVACQTLEQGPSTQNLLPTAVSLAPPLLLATTASYHFKIKILWAVYLTFS